MATSPRQQAARSRAPGPRRNTAAERSASGDGQATCTAMGKAMLAADFREVRAIVGPGPYPRRTGHSITTYEELVTELAEIQRLGYAVDRQELNPGVWCVAAPILGVRQTQPTAVSVSAYRPHLDVIGREARSVPVDSALDYVGG